MLHFKAILFEDVGGGHAGQDCLLFAKTLYLLEAPAPQSNLFGRQAAVHRLRGPNFVCENLGKAEMPIVFIQACRAEEGEGEGEPVGLKEKDLDS